MKKFFKEFKTFITRGNVLDMAVGVIVGGAFTAIVTSLTANFIQPLLDFVTRAHKELYTGTEILGFVSAFLSSVINFLITAFVLFLLVKGINGIVEREKKKKEKPVETAPTTKLCPYCKSEIHIDATRCPHCTSELND